MRADKSRIGRQPVWQRPATPFGALMVLSFTATTVGYGGAAWYVAHAIVHTAK